MTANNANNDSPAIAALRRLIDAYDALQASDGAAVYLDEGTSRTFTVGAWLGQRMAADIDAARKNVAEFDDQPPVTAEPVESIVCAICGNKKIGTMEEIINAGWMPDFWCGVNSEICDGPACPGCSEHRIDFSGEEPTLKAKEDWTR